MLPVSIFLCLVSNTRHRKIDTGNIGHKTQKDRHGSIQIDTDNIGHKTQKDKHG